MMNIRSIWLLLTMVVGTVQAVRRPYSPVGSTSSSSAAASGNEEQTFLSDPESEDAQSSSSSSAGEQDESDQDWYTRAVAAHNQVHGRRMRGVERRAQAVFSALDVLLERQAARAEQAGTRTFLEIHEPKSATDTEEEDAPLASHRSNRRGMERIFGPLEDSIEIIRRVREGIPVGDILARNGRLHGSRPYNATQYYGDTKPR